MLFPITSAKDLNGRLKGGPRLRPDAAAEPKILVTRRLPEPVEARMATLFEAPLQRGRRAAVRRRADRRRSRASDVLVSSITDRIDAELIARLPESVRLIAQFGNGFDNIDIEAAYAAGLTVTNTPSVLTEDTADMAMMLMLALPRRLVEGAEVLPRDGTWPGWSPTWMLGRRLRGKALGIVGMGRIGTAVAARARTFGLDIHYFSRNRRPPQLEEPLERDISGDALDEMVGDGRHRLAAHAADRATPSTSSTPSGSARMRQDAFVVNVSRPELIDEDGADRRDRARASVGRGARRVREPQRHRSAAARRWRAPTRSC